MTALPTTPAILVGLRIDVDTFRGTRDGVVRLLDMLATFDIQTSCFFCVGPDRMGRHLWRLLRPAFLRKMIRSQAVSLYGWDIVLRGLVWPGPVIGQRLGHIIRATAEAGNEVGLHAWDHYAWQTHIDTMDRPAIREVLTTGMDALSRILGQPPRCSAAAGWKCHENVLLEQHRFACRYHSDCRGKSMFRPFVNGTVCAPQIPVTLPTYDEVINHNGLDTASYNDYLLSLITPDKLNVLTIHAEVEGNSCAGLFQDFLRKARQRGIVFLPLGTLLERQDTIPLGTIHSQPISGREGWVCHQTII